MPRLDGTGPRGEGPKTGRNKGNCVNDSNNFLCDRRRCFRNINNRNQIKRNNPN